MDTKLRCAAEWSPPSAPDAPAPSCGCPLMDAVVARIRARGKATAEVLAAEMGMSPAAMRGAVEAHTGHTFAAWVAEWTMRDAEWTLLHTMMPVDEVARRAGYADGSTFGRAFRRRNGMSAEQFRRQRRIVSKQTTYKIKLRQP